MFSVLTTLSAAVGRRMREPLMGFDGASGRGVSRRGLLTALGAAGGLSLTGALGGVAHAASIGSGPQVAGARTPQVPPAKVAAREIRNEFLHAWNGYRRFAWGHDEVHPLSGG